MIKQIYLSSLIILLFALNACGGVAAQNSQPVISTSDSSPEQTFTETLQQRIDQKKIVPEFARLELPVLLVNKPTFAFRENQGTVLQLNIFGYPDPKGAKNIVAPLIEVGATVADQHEISLTGIEVVFHRRDTYNPMQIWANTSPWKEEQMFLTPITDELLEEMK